LVEFLGSIHQVGELLKGEDQVVVEDFVPVPVEERSEKRQGNRGLSPRLLPPYLYELPAFNPMCSIDIGKNLANDPTSRRGSYNDFTRKPPSSRILDLADFSMSKIILKCPSPKASSSI
jgi:hypothetical protein